MISEAHQAACCDLVAGVARIHGKVYLKVAGASMVPVLWPGDLVTVRSCDSSQLQPGSIVVFRQNERLVVHRLMHWVGDCVVARGDARLRYDQPVKAGEVLGRVVDAVRNGRPVNLQPSLWYSVLASVFRRSDWCASVYLRLSSRMRRPRVSAATLEY